ncbi:NF-kappa-B inhibitor epsilon, partial [Bombina bombina]|uniref:NF-kappa-B inhibitor epsilon n=1 Tax=Bombina bombina TaxID=8345 RepID=UPI00235A6806
FSRVVHLLNRSWGKNTTTVCVCFYAQCVPLLITVFCVSCRFLHLAVIHCMPHIALYFTSLLPKEILDIQNDLYQTALHLAVYLNQVKVVQALVWKGANLELQDRRGDTALHVACENQYLDCARSLLQGPNGPQNLQLQNWKGRTCLHIATLARDKSLISLLLQSGAEINVQEGTSGKTSLHMAVEMLDPNVLVHLLQYRPQVDAVMFNGCTPLHLAVGRKDAGLARILCQAGADTLQRNREGDTPQDLAEGNNQLLALLPFDDLKISGKPVVTSA